MSVKVSVILPSLNVAGYIGKCLDSVTGQSLRELEILCIDAGSTDGTREILAEYAGKDTRITVLDSDRKSYGRQVNMGLDYARGRYVAILETDDWIEPEMYQCLYETADRESLDYAAADFDMVWRLRTGIFYHVRHRLFPPDKRDWYGKVLDSEQLALLRASDYVLWRGIYNREFLRDHGIRLHESPGAAFQDMGFLQQVKTFAQRASYVDRSFYRYRQDRESASSLGLDGLRYYKNEFQWIHEELKLDSRLEGVHRQYYYFTMSISFLTKYEQILEKLDGNWRDDRLSESYEWFCRELAAAQEKGFIHEDMYDDGCWERLMLLLHSRERHAVLLTEGWEKRRQCVREFLNRIADRPVVIFGCGVRGERLLFFLEGQPVRTAAFCDNNPKLAGGRKLGLPVLTPAELSGGVYGNQAVVILSMKNGASQVYRQLLDMGIEEDRVIDRIPDGLQG